LIAADRERYEELAVHLGTHPEALREVRDRLTAQRTTWPLFDTPRLVRNLERAYQAMWAVSAAGRPPHPIAVTDPR
jgi:predicted O-linked N-acetylglucosamine transferase (SPINDLY family)